MRVAGYCRADPSARAREDLADQGEQIAAEVARRGWILTDLFHDVGAAHSLHEREGLHRVLDAVESRRAQAIVVTDLSRLSTTPEGIAWLVRSSKRRSWTLVTVADQPAGEDLAEQPPSFAAALAPVIEYITFDCRDPDALATFWSSATGYRKESVRSSAEYAVVSDLAGLGPALWFNRVPEPKVVKNRVHICLNARSLEEEVRRLIAMGARQSAEHSSGSGKRWVVMTDPEGNEFCLIPRSDGDLASAGAVGMVL